MAADAGPRRPLDGASNISHRIAGAGAALRIAACTTGSAARLLEELCCEGIRTACALADDALLLGQIQLPYLRDTIAAGFA